MQGKKKKEVKIKIRGGERREEDGGSERREEEQRAKCGCGEGRRALEPWSLRHQSVMDVRHRTATRPDRD
jgi:hypothetical protein